MRRRSKSSSFEAPSLVPLADMLSNTVGIMMFILVFAVLTAAGSVVVQSFPIVAPTSKTQLLAVCKGNRVLWLDINDVNTSVAEVTGPRDPTYPNSWGHRIDNVKITHRGFDIKGKADFAASEIGDVLLRGRAQILPHDGSGEDAQAAISQGSAFRAGLSGASPDRQFVYFLVYPDSVGVFGSAKALVEHAGFETGWYPMGENTTLPDIIWSSDPSEEGMQFRIQH